MGDMGDTEHTESSVNRTSAELVKPDDYSTGFWQIKKSNALINAVFGMEPVQQQLFTMLLHEISCGNASVGEEEYIQDEKGNKILAGRKVFVYLTTDRCMEYMSKGDTQYERHNIYRNLLRAVYGCKSFPGLIGKVIGIVDERKHYFHFINIFHSLTYKDGTLCAIFSSSVYDQIMNISGNYSVISTRPLFLAPQRYPKHHFSLYEILRSYCPAYRTWGEKGEPLAKWDFNVGFSELLFKLGIVETQDKRVHAFLEGCDPPDFDGAMAYCEGLGLFKGDSGLYTWRDFKRRVLDPTLSAINSNPYYEIMVTYEPVRSRRGKGSPVCSVIFHAALKNKSAAISPGGVSGIRLTQNQQLAIVEILTLVGDNAKLDEHEVLAIAERAGFDRARYQRAIHKTNAAFLRKKARNESISHYAGYILKCLDNDDEAGGTDSRQTGKTRSIAANMPPVDIDCNAVAMKKARERKYPKK